MLISSRTILTAHLPATWASLNPVELHITIILVPPNQEVAIVHQKKVIVTVGLTHYSFLKPNKAVTSEKYAQQIEEMP